MAQQLKIPAQYAGYGQPHPLKPYQPYDKAPEPWLAFGEEGRGRRPGPPHCGRLSPDKHTRHVIKSANSRTRANSGSSKGSQPSSTPHAPRKKRSVLDLLPSTHDLLRKHTYLDSGHLKAVRRGEVSVGGVEDEKPVRPVSRESGGEVMGRRGKMKIVVVRRQAWGDGKRGERDTEPEKQVVKIQPFRRAVTTAPPDGIPPLDLTKLNEPDHEMDTVELISVDDEDSDTARSGLSKLLGYQRSHPLLSWGVPFSKSPDQTGDHTGEEGEETERGGGGVGRESGEEVEEIEEEISESRQTRMDLTHTKFVEEKVLSHERAISSLSPHHPHTLTSPPSPHHTSTSPLPLQPGQKVGVAMQSHVTFGLGMCEADLSRRLRFEARVLTQNGRDVHRDLCGFFFLADSSITVYEFRQFGKKSCALPLVQRKVYRHQLGHSKGEPYQINFIRKGSTLHFPTSLLPSLPDCMTSRPLLSLRITQCSEREKRQLLCVNRKPTECVSIDAYLQQPLSPPQQQAWTQLRALQGGIRRQLVGRAKKTLVGLGRFLSKPHFNSSPLIKKDVLKSALHTYHIHISDKDFNRLWQLLIVLGEFGAGSEGVREGEGEGVWCDRWVTGLVGEMDEDRKAIVRKVFQKLDSTKSGLVSITNIHRFYRHTRTPHDMEGVWFDHTHMTSQHIPMTTISYADFENYYEGVSIETSKNVEFITSLKTDWTL